MPQTPNIDGVLIQWGDRLFYPGNRVVKTKPQPKLGASAARHRAAAIRERIEATVVRRAPQVMVKVTGGGRGMKAIAAHFRYISKNGRLDIEDERGETMRGKDTLPELADDWRFGGTLIDDIGDRREAFNIMLSMPRGTDPLAVQKAAREFAQIELADHKYVMVLHDHQAEPRLHRDRDTVRENAPADPIDDGAQIDPALGHRDVCDVGGPGVVGARDLDPTQQVRVHLVLRVLAACVRFAVRRLNAHANHQRAQVLAAHLAVRNDVNSIHGKCRAGQRAAARGLTFSATFNGRGTARGSSARSPAFPGRAECGCRSAARRLHPRCRRPASGRCDRRTSHASRAGNVYRRRC